MMILPLVWALTVGSSLGTAVSSDNSSACDATDPPPRVLSYHLHIFFHANDAASASLALALRDEYVAALGWDLERDGVCPFGHLQPAAAYDAICPFPLEFDADGPYAGTGPFDLPNFSFFIPVGAAGDVLAWWAARRGALSTILHPNTGCQDNDHSDWYALTGVAVSLNVPAGLACCHSGPPGCTCYVTVYELGNGDHDDAPLCLVADATSGAVMAGACNADDPAKNAVWAETNLTATHHRVDAFTTYPRPDRCLACAGGTACAEGAALALGECAGGGFSFNASARRLVLDDDPRLCVQPETPASDALAVLGACDDDAAHIERACLYAPGTGAAPCPDVQY